MAAAVAHQHAGLWHRRPDHFHIPDLHFTGMMPSYDHQRTGVNTPLRNYQAVTTQLDISLPLFSANALATSVPYQSSGTFAYDSSANPYSMQPSNMQTSYSMSYPSNMSPAVSFADRPDHQPNPIARETRHPFALDGNHMVKSESASPIQTSPMYSNTSYASECKRSSSEPVDTANINFATDVDTLMKAIQAKQTTSPQKQEAPKVSTKMTF
jgi:hypothetical protein